MPPRIKVTLNHPRNELVKEGWAQSRPAISLQPGKWENGEYKQASAPPGLIFDPSLGAYMLTPSVFTAGFAESDEWAAYQFAKSDIEWGDPDQYIEAQTVSSEIGAVKKIMASKRSTAAKLVELSIVAALAAILADIEGDLVCVGRTMVPLLPNEGFSVIINPAGLAFDRAVSLFGVAFGQRFFLSVGMNGEFWVSYNRGTNDDPDWTEIHRERFSDGSVQHSQPYQVTVIPAGLHSILVMFSQQRRSKGRLSTEGTQFAVNLAEAGIECPWDDNIAQHIKTPAGELYLFLRASRYNVTFSVHKVRYPQEVIVALGPISTPVDGTPEVNLRGFYDYDNSRPNAPKIAALPVKPDGDPWGESTREGSLAFVFKSSPNQVYSPELWFVHVEIPEEIHVPDWTPVDVSAKWSYLRIQQSAQSNASRIEMKLHDQPFERTYYRGGPVRVEIGDRDGENLASVFDGYIHDREPTPFGVVKDGVRGKSREELAGQDMWSRINEQTLAQSLAIDGASVGYVIRRALQRAGFASEDIEVSDDVMSLNFADFESTDELETFSPDTYVGDVIRDIQKYVNVQLSDGLRVRWTGEKWEVYFAFGWDIADEYPDIMFVLDSDLATGSDEDRWAQNIFYCHSDFEPTISLPKFNSLEVLAKKNGSTSDDAVAAVISPGPELTDPDSPEFEGRVRNEVIGPPETARWGTVEKIQQAARVYYDRERRRGRTASILAEWQPSVKPDQFCMIVGRAPDGTPVSFGCWRIESIDIELSSDIAEPIRTDFTWNASYSLVYQGPTAHPEIPMFDEWEEDDGGEEEV